MGKFGSKPVIGLLGGIGSGKSTVARCFEKLGCAVIDADALARDAINDPAVIEQLRQWWGDQVVTVEGGIDRKAVAQIVFDDPVQKQRLESLIHPRVHEGRAKLRAIYESDANVVAIVEDCPLLLETGLDDQCDLLIFVGASLQTRLQRVAVSRGWTAEELARREKSQFGLDMKAKRADHVLMNEGDEVACMTHVRRVLSQILTEIN